MHKSIRKQLFFRPLIITLTLLTPILNSCETTAEADAPFDRQQNASEPLSQYQKDILDLAFDAATQIPVGPHIKDRLRAQEAVVLASIELDRPALALGSIDGTFGNAADSIQKKLENSLAELNAVREQAANEKIPLSRKIGVGKQ